MKIYFVNEIFRSLQGEGLRAGTSNIFIRFTGCNLKCSLESSELSPGGFDCDTEFVSGRPMTAQEILDFCKEIDPICQSIIYTGGEPTLQLDEELCDAIRQKGYYQAIETNGSKAVTVSLDWITVSPKVAEHAIRQLEANEVKYVRAYGQGIPRTVVKAQYHLISPAFEGVELNARNLAWCIKLVQENPTWRLSTQQHKAWKVR